MSSSSTATNGFSTAANDTRDMQLKHAFIVGSSVLLLILILVAIRFAFYYVLDVCCEVDGGTRRRALSEWLRKVFPVWNVRTQPSPAENSSGMRQQQPTANHHHFHRHSEQLPVYILTEQDILDWKEDYKDTELQQQKEQVPDDSTETSAILCSICLAEMKVGDKVFRQVKCPHIFHHSCLTQWAAASLSSSSMIAKSEIHCPNCRACIHHISHCHPQQQDDEAN